MSILAKTEIISGRTVTVTPFPGRTALFYKAQLIKMFGPSLAVVISKQFTTGEDVAPILEKFLQGISITEFSNLTSKLLASTLLDDMPITDAVFDLEFAGNLTLMYKILGFVLKVNYADFFEMAAIGNLVSQAKLKQETSTAAK